MDPSLINEKLLIKQCPNVSKGLGVFATRRLSKGLRLLEESPLLSYECSEDAIEDIEHDFGSLPLPDQARLVRLFAGIFDTVPVIKMLQQDEAGLATAPQRLKKIVRYNSVEGQGTGCVLLFNCSFLNHSCVPNAWLYWNDALNAVTLHAIRDISKEEEVTISYFQESVYLNRLERNARLGN
ncbi:hypothetical protein F4818DRAFT_345847 [Hypoxylon cercidicola]|nr:hypothetical protein F4818DRAFT_345847 [Hypoxylon cercidicola]